MMSTAKMFAPFGMDMQEKDLIKGKGGRKQKYKKVGTISM